jgi:hypothetical protein
MSNFEITKEEAEQLSNLLSKQYISYEHHPLVIILNRRLQRYLEDYVREE